MKTISDMQKSNAENKEKMNKEYKPKHVREDFHKGYRPKPAGESSKRWESSFKGNPAQKAMSKVLGKAGHEIDKHKKKEGEAPLEHLKRLTK